MQTFTQVKENKIKPINHIHDTILDRTISKNCDKLAPIVKTVLLCARHNIPLRGHRDDSDNYETDNCGNFQALLDFRVDSGDKVLEEHFQTAPRHKMQLMVPKWHRMKLFLAVLKQSQNKLSKK